MTFGPILIGSNRTSYLASRGTAVLPSGFGGSVSDSFEIDRSVSGALRRGGLPFEEHGGPRLVCKRPKPQEKL
jgi:hypothetical protein